MVLVPRNRVFVVALTVMLLAAGCGMVAGYIDGWIHTRQAVLDQLRKDATKSSAMLDSLLNESRSLLGVLNGSQYPPCSNAEIAWFRKLVYRAKNLRDAGRMRDGRMECSALFSEDDLPRTVFQPSITRQDGTKFYRDLPPYQFGDPLMFIMQQGNSYVVEDPGFQDRLEQVSSNVQTTMTDAPSQRRARPSGFPLAVPGAILDREAQGEVGDALYVTRCSPETLICATAYGSFSEALKADQGQLFLYTALGGLSGAFLVLVFALARLRSRSMSQQLRRAIRRDELKVLYQPIVELTSGRIVEAEALTSWTDEEGFEVGPEVFVRIAEDHGFVGELTALVVRHVLRDFREILRGNSSFQMNVNVTASDLADERFLPMLEGSLPEAGVPPQRLGIEITESSTARKQVAIEAIRQLRTRGHCVQIDDFGTGYSSLAYLRDLAVDAFKIDKSFTQAVGTRAVFVDLLPQILSMAELLNLQVIVEGIETVEQEAYFKGLARPVLGQGWLFGRPVSAAEFLAYLAAGKMAEPVALRG